MNPKNNPNSYNSDHIFQSQIIQNNNNIQIESDNLTDTK